MTRKRNITSEAMTTKEGPLEEGKVDNRPLNVADANTFRDHNRPKPVVNQNLVQWLPRDPVSGDERIRIAVPGKDQEYLFIERAGPQTGMIILEYLQKMEPVRYVLVCKNEQVVNCTCKDFYKRGKPCKHIRALNAALKQRRVPIEFAEE